MLVTAARRGSSLGRENLSCRPKRMPCRMPRSKAVCVSIREGAADTAPFPTLIGGSLKFLRNKVQPRIKTYAKRLRKNQTLQERILWDYLRSRRLGGLRFRRQCIVRGYIVDFYCPSKRLAVEVDGLGHDKNKDDLRDARIWEK